MDKRMLIVDDINFIVDFEKTVLDSLAKELNINIEVDVANTVTEAIRLIDGNRYDALVLDMNLPDGTGVEVARAALDKDESVKIAALTIYPNRYEKDRAYFSMFLKKPIMPKLYKESVCQLLKI